MRLEDFEYKIHAGQMSLNCHEAFKRWLYSQDLATIFEIILRNDWIIEGDLQEDVKKFCMRLMEDEIHEDPSNVMDAMVTMVNDYDMPRSLITGTEYGEAETEHSVDSQ